MKKLWKWLFGTRNKQLDIPVVSNSLPQIYFKCSGCGKEYKYIMGENCPFCGNDY